MSEYDRLVAQRDAMIARKEAPVRAEIERLREALEGLLASHKGGPERIKGACCSAADAAIDALAPPPTRDSGRHAQRENSRSEVEAEGCQSGDSEAGASPKGQGK